MNWKWTHSWLLQDTSIHRPFALKTTTNLPARNTQPYSNTTLRAAAHYHDCTAVKTDPCIQTYSCITPDLQRRHIKVDLQRTHTQSLFTQAQREALFKAIHTLWTTPRSLYVNERAGPQDSLNLGKMGRRAIVFGVALFGSAVSQRCRPN